MACPGLNEIIDTGIAGILSYPNSCDYYFWAKIMAALFIILSFILFFRDEDKIGKGDMISSLGVSGIAIGVLTVIGTSFSIIPTDVGIEIIVGCLIFAVIWMFKR